MKKIIVFTALSMLAISFTACKKDSATPTPATTVLTASKTTGIKQGEPVIFTAANVTVKDTAKWTVSPSANTQINASGASASILFKQKGQYTVTALVAGIMSRSTVTVTDSIYKGTGPAPTTYSSVALTGDQLTLTPSVNDSANYVAISTLTKNQVLNTLP